jgi:LPS-assembly protein
MNFKTQWVLLSGIVLATALFGVTGCSTPLAYEETRTGHYFYVNPFAHKPATPQEHWDYAAALEERGKIGKARKQFDILLQRWPESVLAASAKQVVADLYFAEGEDRKAFDTYQELIDDYYTGIRDYNAVLERQFAIAEREMKRKRMRWLFGGYTAPERAIPYFESILRNAPQWDRSAEAQYLIGKAYHRNGDEELAIVACATVEYRYPDSPFAEKAAFTKIECLQTLVRAVPYSVDIREQAQLSVRLFETLYPGSEHLAAVEAFGAELDEQAARQAYETGGFYERVPRPPATGSAKIYYEKVIAQFGGTEWAVKSAERLSELTPADAESAAEEVEPAAEPVTAEKKTTDIAAELQGAPAGRSLPERLTADDEAMEVTADRMEYADKLLIAEGNVVFQQQDTSLRADRVTVNPDTGAIAASGSIVMERGDNYWEGEALDYNFKTRAGSFGSSAMFFDPAYITADETKRVSSNEFLLRNVTITTCSGEKPAVYARARELRLIDRNFIVAKHVTFYAGPVPLFYMPHWQRHLNHRIFTTYIGYGSRVGGFFKTRTNLRLADWLIADTHLDYFSDRGVGAGQDFTWQTANGHGGIEAYYINDEDPYDDEDTGPRRALIDDDRWRVKLTHRQQVDDETYFQTRFNYLSDPDILEDFFNGEFRGEANPENYAVLQHSTESYAAGLRVDHRLNDFYTTVDRLPDLSLDWYRGRVPGTPFQFESRNSFAYLERLYSITNAPPPGDYHSGRLDTYNRLFLPLRFFDFLNVIPRGGWRGTWYSDTVTGDEEVRNIFELGVLTSFKAYKTLTENSAFFGTGLRHVIEPYADYSWRDKPNLETNDLYFFDGTDLLDEQNEVRFGLRNFLQTKRGSKRIANFLDTDVYTTYRFEPQTAQEDFSNLVAQAEMSLTDSFSVEANLEYDWYSRIVSPANARMNLMTSDSSTFSLEYRYIDNERSLITPSLSLFPNANWSFDFLARYDAERDGWEERRVLVSHKFDCVGMGLGYRCDEDNEHQVWIQFWLTAFPRASLDLGR